MSKTKTAPAAAVTDRYDAFSVRNFEIKGETRADWTRVGVAFPNADGKGFRLTLSALPLDGVVILRLHEPKPAE